MVSEQRYVEDELCVDTYCSVQLRPLTVDFDNGLVDRDPPLAAPKAGRERCQIDDVPTSKLLGEYV